MFRIFSENENAKFQDMLRNVEQEREHLLYMDEDVLLQEKGGFSIRKPVGVLKVVLAALIRLMAGMIA